MCNLSDGVWEEAMTKGMAQGIEKGMAQGMAQRIEKGLATALQNLMESMGWSIEQAMNALRIPEADRQGYAAQIAKQ